MKEVKDLEVLTIDGKTPLRLPPDGWTPSFPGDPPPPPEAATVARLLKVLIYNSKIETMGDAEHGRRVLQALDARKDGAVALEDADYEWLSQLLILQGPRLFGINAITIKEALEGC